MLRLPLATTCLANQNIDPQAREKATRVCGKVAALRDDELLLKAVALSPWSMTQLGQEQRCAPNAVVPAATALRLLGHGHDGCGGATYNPAVGAISCRLLQLEAALAAEQQHRCLVEQQLAALTGQRRVDYGSTAQGMRSSRRRLE